MGSTAQSLCKSLNAAERGVRRKTHDTIRRVTIDIEDRQQLNTAISAMMELVNELYGVQRADGDRGARKTGQTRARFARVRAWATTWVTLSAERRSVWCGKRWRALIRLLAPFAPHTAEEMWELLGHETAMAAATWPTYDANVARADEIVVPVQINGKVRSRLTVPVDVPEHELERLALADPAIRSYTTGKTVKKVVVAKGRLVSVVIQ